MRLSIPRLVPLLLGLTALSICADQDILTILGANNDLSSFSQYLQQFPDIVSVLNGGKFTVLAPNNNAIGAFLANNTNLAEDAVAIRGLLQYHCVNGTHPSAGFGLNPSFPATLLSDPQFANVTGGQVVELTLENNAATIVSGMKAQSHIVQPDTFFIGGLIHVVDSVLTIPISNPATITAAGLDNLVALLNKGGWLDPSSSAAAIVNELPDLSGFAPNSLAFGPTFTGFDSLSQDSLMQIFNYSFVQGPVIYSSEFKNNSKFTTLLGLPFTLTDLNGNVYVDAAQITVRDFITSNGVLQILDSPLNPNATGARPVPTTPTDAASSSSSGLSSAAAAGVGIGIGAVLIGVVVTLGLLARARKRRGLPLFGNPNRPHRLPEENMIPPPNRYSRGGSGMIATDGVGVEMRFPDQNDHPGSATTSGYGDPRFTYSTRSPPPPFEAHELDNKAFPSPRGSPPERTGSTTTHVVEIHTPSSRRTSPTRARSPSQTTNKSTNRSRRQSQSQKLGMDGFPLSDAQQPLPSPKPLEIDGRERGRISISITGEPPRHLGFQARY